MKKFMKRSTAILLTVLMLCSMVTITLPTSVGAKASSKWYMGGGSTIVSESSEIWVVDTVRATIPANGYIQHNEQLTELIGKDGKDGKGYVNVIFGDGSAKYNADSGYGALMLVAKSDPTQAIEFNHTGTQAVVWRFRGDGGSKVDNVYTEGRIANPAQSFAISYGLHANIAAEGYRVTFTRDENNQALIRGIGNGVYSSAANYSSYNNQYLRTRPLTDLPGDNDETAADGVYLRIGLGGEKTITVTVAYPMPADYDAERAPMSRWSLSSGGSIVEASSEYLIVDTATVEMPGTTGYFQYSEKLTELIGKDGKDGKGFVNVIFGDGTASYNKDAGYASVMLVGKADPTLAIPVNTVNNQALNWALRGDGGDGIGRLANAPQNSATVYSTSGAFAATGYRFAFTSKSDQAYIRGIGQYVAGTGIAYSSTQTVTTKLTAIAGDNGETAADGVYFRMQTRRSSDPCVATVTIAYPVQAEGLNLVPADVFASKEKASQWFKGSMAGTFSEEEGEYVYHVPKSHLDMYTSRSLPDGSFTVKMNIKSDDSGYMGILLGYGSSPNDCKWMNIRFDPNYTAKTIDFYVWEHCNLDPYPATPKYGTSWYKGDFSADSWHEVIFEVTPTKTTIYFDGYQTPDFQDPYVSGSIKDTSLGHFPTSEELNYIGFFPSGATQSIKNFGVYEGVGLEFNLVPENVFYSYTTAKAWFTNVQETNAYDQTNCYTVDENGDCVMRVPVVNSGNAWIYMNRTIPYKSYTVSVDFSPNEYTSEKIGGAGFLVGEKVSSGYHFHQIRFNFDKTAGTISFRGHAQGNAPGHGYPISGSIEYIDNFTVVKDGIDFSTKQWFNLTAEVTGNSIQVFLDGEQLFVEKIDRLPAAEDIAYFGFMAEGSTAGYDIKNFSIYEGVDGEIKTAAPELNEAITLHYSADVDVDDAESVQMKFTFKSKDIWVDGVLSGDQYTFALPDILPQDMCENITAQLYIDGMRKDKVATYSLQQYCMNIMPTAEEAAADANKQDLRNLLIALLNYGTESQKYFEGITDAALFANSQLTDAEKNSVKQDMTEAESVRDVSERGDANNYWKSASLALFDTVRLRFKFVTDDASKITIKVEGDSQTYTNFELSTGNIYYWDYNLVYANEFDKPVVVGLYVDGVCVQTVTYSINTYVNVFVAANDAQANSYAIVQAVYDYGCMASAYDQD
ncbi:MAG: hypothetical protein IKU26_08160 [Clostridia bacterium]|nr:hypothetical protein [Clostridia bacterium]